MSISFITGMTLPTYAADLNYFYNPFDTAANNSLNADSNALNVINYYEALQGDLSTEAETIITETFSNLSDYMGSDGVDNAIAAGFRPFTPIFKGHGVHYVKPLNILDPAVATDPLGLNFDEHGNLVAAFYFQEQYLVNRAGTGLYSTLEGVESNELLTHYQNFKENNTTTAPDIFEDFGSLASWHTHNDVKIDNIGSLDSEEVIFGQDLSDEEWVNALLLGLSNSEIQLAVYEEFDTSDPSKYPFYNTLMTPGFHMIHMWLGAENHDGLFAGTHDNVAPNAVDEHGGHGSHGKGEIPPESQDPTSVPEPSVLAMLATGGWLGLVSAFKRRLNKAK
ncbi:hypothetical protein CY0110_19552 [Crocosphaera chwakensis CCY0110]|uniref:PEP-CTERM protein-sorting domain-containing protein n=2 Tax=Crocosphaera TaxID=263510 RepID=A3IJP2_9CHRO|nr:hypothetical protein CY0110_19552 [Crocosphaera chwakensis CCY0110]